MNRKAAKELLHIQSWLIRVDQIAPRGKEEYVADALLQEAGDSLMMKPRRWPSRGFIPAVRRRA